ncbi:MAG: hypothetical protein M1140_07330 [Chloroflexi bacterium]|nr:hypothetical protein [Chloroflexota bacterium]
MTKYRLTRRASALRKLLALAVGAGLCISLATACESNSPSNQLLSPVASATAALNDAQRNATKQALGALDAQRSPLASGTAPAPESITSQKAPRQPVTKDSGIFLPIPGGTPTGMGTIVDVQPPFSTYQYHIENGWYLDSQTGLQRLMAYAGNVSGPAGEVTDQGVLVLQTSVISATNGQSEVRTLNSTAYTVTASGSLRVIGAQPDRLLLQSSTGQGYIFQISSHQFSGTAKQ